MSITVNDNLQNNSPKSLDNKYMQNGLIAYTSVSAANIALNYRHRGLKVRISVDGEELEYWYKYGILDTDLVPVSVYKQTSATDISINVPSGEFVKRILVNPIGQLDALKVGTSSGAEDILPEMIIPVGSWFNISVEKYASSAITFYFTGITSNTQIRIYID